MSRRIETGTSSAMLAAPKGPSQEDFLGRLAEYVPTEINVDIYVVRDEGSHKGLPVAPSSASPIAFPFLSSRQETSCAAYVVSQLRRDNWPCVCGFILRMGKPKPGS
jgi:hypothetical protein